VFSTSGLLFSTPSPPPLPTPEPPGIDSVDLTGVTVILPPEPAGYDSATMGFNVTIYEAAHFDKNGSSAGGVGWPVGQLPP
jgi:hypothetical protein